MIGVDVGGTFTDVVAVRNGAIKTVKVPTDVRETEQGVFRGAAEIGVTESTIFNHASTHGLNAVITRRLPKIAFLTTAGPPPAPPRRPPAGPTVSAPRHPGAGDRHRRRADPAGRGAGP
jgi:hypothetical protein